MNRLKIFVFWGSILMGLVSTSVLVGAQEQTGLNMNAFSMPANGLKRSFVCMVNDQFMNKEQIPVRVGEKMYYGCCKACVTTLTSNREFRYAKDPLTGKEVDKSNAYIAVVSRSGDVSYFESIENYERYAQKTGKSLS